LGKINFKKLITKTKGEKIMAWLAVDKTKDNFNEVIIASSYPNDVKPIKVGSDIDYFIWTDGIEGWNTRILLPNGTIKKILGYELTCDDEPVRLL